MGPIWGRQDPGGRHVGPMNLVIWGGIYRHLYGHRSSITSLGAYVRNLIPQYKYTVYYAPSSHVAIFWVGSVAVGIPILSWINSLALSASEANLSLSGSEATLENPDILSTDR